MFRFRLRVWYTMLYTYMLHYGLIVLTTVSFAVPSNMLCIICNAFFTIVPQLSVYTMTEFDHQWVRAGGRPRCVRVRWNGRRKKKKKKKKCLPEDIIIMYACSHCGWSRDNRSCPLRCGDGRRRVHRARYLVTIFTGRGERLEWVYDKYVTYARGDLLIGPDDGCSQSAINPFRGPVADDDRATRVCII